MFDERYWRSIINFPGLLDHGMVEPSHCELFRFAEDAEELWATLVSSGLKVHTG